MHVVFMLLVVVLISVITQFDLHRMQISVGMPEGIELCVAIEDYEDEVGDLKREQSVLVLDKVSRSGMYKVVKIHPDGSHGDTLWVPSKILQRRTSRMQVQMKGGVFY